MRESDPAGDESSASGAEHLIDEGEIFARRYRIQELIGIGGFAKVYRAVDTELDRKVAIKIHAPEGGEPDDRLSTLEKRFYREASLLAELDSAHTIRLFDYGRTGDGQLYMVCEYVHGTNLKKLLQTDAPFGEERTRNILVQILRSLHDAHARSILHRDVKPSNVMVCDRPGRGEHVKMLDFGIAKTVSAESERQQQLTAEGMVIGTPKYMSPEQTLGQPLGAESDLFSVGLLVYEMLVGRSPFEGSTLRAVRRRFESAPIRLPVALDIDDELRRVTNGLLERDREERFSSVRVALDELGAGTEDEEDAQLSSEQSSRGVSYPVGLGSTPGTNFRNVAPATETTSSDQVLPGASNRTSRHSAVPSMDPTRVTESAEGVAPTVVDPEVRDPTVIGETAVEDESTVTSEDPKPVPSGKEETAIIATGESESESPEPERAGTVSGSGDRGPARGPTRIAAAAALLLAVGIGAYLAWRVPEAAEGDEAGAAPPSTAEAAVSGSDEPEAPETPRIEESIRRASDAVAESLASGGERAERAAESADEESEATAEAEEPEREPPSSAESTPSESGASDPTAAESAGRETRRAERTDSRRPDPDRTDRGDSATPSDSEPPEDRGSETEPSEEDDPQKIEPVDELIAE